MAAQGWVQVGASFHPLTAQGEANALGNAEGADGVEFLRVKMLFKVYFFPINCSEIVLKKWVRTEHGTGILLFWLQGLCMLINYQKGPCPPKSPAVGDDMAATHPFHCHLWLWGGGLSLFTHLKEQPQREKARRMSPGCTPCPLPCCLGMGTEVCAAGEDGTGCSRGALTCFMPNQPGPARKKLPPSLDATRVSSLLPGSSGSNLG